MTQDELDFILLNHNNWLKTNGKEGAQAKFDVDYLNEIYGRAKVLVQFMSSGGIASTECIPLDENGIQDLEWQSSHFSGLDFRRIDFTGADVGGAIFHQCNMEFVNFSGCDLSKTKFGIVNLVNANFGILNFPKAILNNAIFSGCDFRNCFLQHINFDGCNISNSNFSDCSMAGASFVNGVANRTNFESAWLKDSNFEGCSLKEAIFKNVDLTASNISLTNLNLTSFENSNLSGVKCKPRSFYSRLKEAFLEQFKPKHIGCRVESSYGNGRLKRAINDEAFVEEFARDNPLMYKIWLVSCDCGRSMRLWSFWSSLVVLIFACIFHFSLESSQFTFNDNIVEKESFTTFLYYSIVVFTTLGFGDITPVCGVAMFFVTLEVVTGFIMLGLLISIFANKVSSRS